ncbi:MAG: hypothetical protein QOE55_6724 [Acidobacteriaceae bacterium]|jgi:hypothetical protein|nr:hypothetical protein [Acidobacteriaceae bacterium]
MTVVNQKETRADLGEVAETGIHPPEPTDALSHVSPEEDHVISRLALIVVECECSALLDGGAYEESEAEARLWPVWITQIRLSLSVQFVR